MKTLWVIVRAREPPNLVVEGMEFCAAQLEGVCEDTAVRIARELRREAVKVRQRGVTPDLLGKISAWRGELEQLLEGVKV